MIYISVKRIKAICDIFKVSLLIPFGGVFVLLGHWDVAWATWAAWGWMTVEVLVDS